MNSDKRRRTGLRVFGSRFDDLDSPTRRFVTYLAALGGLLLLWWAFAGLVMPELFRLTHEGRDLPLLSHFMAGRETTPLDAYLTRWAEIRGGVSLLLVVFGLLSLTFAFTLPAITERLEGSGPSLPLMERGVGLLWAGGILLLTLAVLALSHLAPVAYIYAITEDYWVEHATFAAFMLAGGFFLWAAVLRPGHPKLGLLGFALAAFFVGMEEVSWGQRIIGIETPELLEAYNYQGELGLHNIWFPRHTVVGLVVVLYGVALPPLARRWDWLKGLLRRLAVPLPRSPLRPLFLLAGALLIYSAYSPAYFKVDEVAEFALGVAVLMLGLDLAMKAGTESSPGARAALFSGTGTLAAVVIATGVLVYLAPSPDGFRWRLNDFAAHRFPNAGMYGQAQTLFRYMERNPEWQTALTRREHGRLLLEIGETERAHRVLEGALEEQRLRLAANPAALAEVRRVEGEVHLLLRRHVRAEEAFQKAVAADRARLAEAESDGERAHVHWSLALTAEAYGDAEAAFRHAAIACEMAEERQLRRRIEYWADRLTRLEVNGERPAPCEEEVNVGQPARR